MKAPPDIVQRIVDGYAAFSRGDIDAALAGLPPDMRWDLCDRVFNPAVLEGHDAYRRDLEAMREQWEQVELVVEDVLVAADRVVVLTHDRFRGRAAASRSSAARPTYGRSATGSRSRCASTTTASEPCATRASRPRRAPAGPRTRCGVVGVLLRVEGAFSLAVEALSSAEFRSVWYLGRYSAPFGVRWFPDRSERR